MGALRQVGRVVGIGLALLLLGCATEPLLDSKDVVPPDVTGCEPNPLYVAWGRQSYPQVWENVLKVLADAGFQIGVSNRFDGRIEAVPRIAAGCGLFFKPGSPDHYERTLATLQSIRHRLIVAIHPAESEGYFISVIAYRELEDLPRPVRATAGAALFRSENNVERTFDIVDPTIFESNWIPRGRDAAIEQDILKRLRACM